MPLNRQDRLGGGKALLLRLRELIVEASSIVRWGGKPKAYVEQLAFEIVDYARMNAPVLGTVIVEVPEIAFRLRESRFNVRRGLRLLEMKGVARKTSSKDHWRLTA